MRLRLFRRRPVEETGTVIATYPFTRRTAQMLLLKNGRVRWTCDCESAQRATARNLTPWCKHIERPRRSDPSISCSASARFLKSPTH